MNSKLLLQLIVAVLTFSYILASQDENVLLGNEPSDESKLSEVTNYEEIINSTLDAESSSYVEGSQDIQLDQLANATSVNSTDSNNTQKFVKCIPSGSSEVQLVNDTELIKLLMPLQNVTGKDIPAPCVLVLFYSKYCPFSSMAAPHFNALPRAFPGIKMVAINAMMYHLFNTQNGIVGVPSLLLFHNGKPVAKFNQSEYSLELFSKFLTRHTGITAEEKSHVTSGDFSGPVTSVPSKESDMFLVISWMFIHICAIYYFTKSRWWQWIVETIQSNWRESAQHEHGEGRWIVEAVQNNRRDPVQHEHND